MAQFKSFTDAREAGFIPVSTWLRWDLDPASAFPTDGAIFCRPDDLETAQAACDASYARSVADRDREGRHDAEYIAPIEQAGGVWVPFNAAVDPKSDLTALERS